MNTADPTLDSGESAEMDNANPQDVNVLRTLKVEKYKTQWELECHKTQLARVQSEFQQAQNEMAILKNENLQLRQENRQNHARYDQLRFSNMAKMREKEKDLQELDIQAKHNKRVADDAVEMRKQFERDCQQLRAQLMELREHASNLEHRLQQQAHEFSSASDEFTAKIEIEKLNAKHKAEEASVNHQQAVELQGLNDNLKNKVAALETEIDDYREALLNYVPDDAMGDLKVMRQQKKDEMQKLRNNLADARKTIADNQVLFKIELDQAAEKALADLNATRDELDASRREGDRISAAHAKMEMLNKALKEAHDTLAQESVAYLVGQCKLRSKYAVGAEKYQVIEGTPQFIEDLVNNHRRMVEDYHVLHSQTQFVISQEKTKLASMWEEAQRSKTATIENERRKCAAAIGDVRLELAAKERTLLSVLESKQAMEEEVRRLKEGELLVARQRDAESEYQRIITQLRSQLDAVHVAETQARTKGVRLQMELKATNEELHRKEQMVECLKERVMEAERKNETFHRKLSQAEVMIADGESLLWDQKCEIHDLQAQIQQTEQRRSEALAEIQNRDQSVAALCLEKETLSTQLSDLKKQFEVAVAFNTEFTERFYGAKTREISALEKDFGESVSSKKEILEMLRESKRSNEQLVLRAETAEQAHKDALREHAAVEKWLRVRVEAGNPAKLAKLRAESQLKDAQIAQQESVIADLRETHDTLKQLQQSSEVHAADLLVQRKVADERIEGLKKQLEASQARAVKFRQEANDVKEAHMAHSAQLRDEIAALHTAKEDALRAVQRTEFIVKEEERKVHAEQQLVIQWRKKEEDLVQELARGSHHACLVETKLAQCERSKKVLETKLFAYEQKENIAADRDAAEMSISGDIPGIPSLEQRVIEQTQRMQDLLTELELSSAKVEDMEKEKHALRDRITEQEAHIQKLEDIAAMKSASETYAGHIGPIEKLWANFGRGKDDAVAELQTLLKQKEQEWGELHTSLTMQQSKLTKELSTTQHSNKELQLELKQARAEHARAVKQRRVLDASEQERTARTNRTLAIARTLLTQRDELRQKAQSINHKHKALQIRHSKEQARTEFQIELRRQEQYKHEEVVKGYESDLLALTENSARDILLARKQAERSLVICRVLKRQLSLNANNSSATKRIGIVEATSCGDVASGEIQVQRAVEEVSETVAEKRPPVESECEREGSREPKAAKIDLAPQKVHEKSRDGAPLESDLKGIQGAATLSVAGSEPTPCCSKLEKIFDAEMLGVARIGETTSVAEIEGISEVEVRGVSKREKAPLGDRVEMNSNVEVFAVAKSERPPFGCEIEQKPDAEELGIERSERTASGPEEETKSDVEVLDSAGSKKKPTDHDAEKKTDVSALGAAKEEKTAYVPEILDQSDGEILEIARSKNTPPPLEMEEKSDVVNMLGTAKSEKMPRAPQVEKKSDVVDILCTAKSEKTPPAPEMEDKSDIVDILGTAKSGKTPPPLEMEDKSDVVDMLGAAKSEKTPPSLEMKHKTDVVDMLGTAKGEKAPPASEMEDKPDVADVLGITKSGKTHLGPQMEGKPDFVEMLGTTKSEKTHFCPQIEGTSDVAEMLGTARSEKACFGSVMEEKNDGEVFGAARSERTLPAPGIEAKFDLKLLDVARSEETPHGHGIEDKSNLKVLGIERREKTPFAADTEGKSDGDALVVASREKALSGAEIEEKPDAEALGVEMSEKTLSAPDIERKSDGEALGIATSEKTLSGSEIEDKSDVDAFSFARIEKTSSVPEVGGAPDMEAPGASKSDKAPSEPEIEEESDADAPMPPQSENIPSDVEPEIELTLDENVDEEAMNDGEVIPQSSYPCPSSKSPHHDSDDNDVDMMALPSPPASEASDASNDEAEGTAACAQGYATTPVDELIFDVEEFLHEVDEIQLREAQQMQYEQAVLSPEPWCDDLKAGEPAVTFPLFNEASMLMLDDEDDRTPSVLADALRSPFRDEDMYLDDAEIIEMANEECDISYTLEGAASAAGEELEAAASIAGEEPDDVPNAADEELEAAASVAGEEPEAAASAVVEEPDPAASAEVEESDAVAGEEPEAAPSAAGEEPEGALSVGYEELEGALSVVGEELEECPSAVGEDLEGASSDADQEFEGTASAIGEEPEGAASALGEEPEDAVGALVEKPANVTDPALEEPEGAALSPEETRGTVGEEKEKRNALRDEA